MELHAEDIVALDRAGIGQTVIGPGADIRWIAGPAIIGVIEIDIGSGVEPLEQTRLALQLELVPARVRDLDRQRLVEADNLAGQQTQARVLTHLFAYFEE